MNKISTKALDVRTLYLENIEELPAFWKQDEKQATKKQAGIMEQIQRGVLFSFNDNDKTPAYKCLERKGNDITFVSYRTGKLYHATAKKTFRQISIFKI